MKKNNSTYAIAKRIRQEMTTKKAGCYRLSKLTKTATIRNVEALYKAMMETDEEKSRERWDEVFKTTLYNDKSADYTHILAYIATEYRCL